MVKSSLGIFLAVVLLLASLSACESDSSSGQVCTLILCVNTLNIVTNTRQFSLQATANTGETREVTCPNNNNSESLCNSTGVSLFNFTPIEVDLTIITPDGRRVSSSVTPIYQTFEPNGPGCGTCQQGTITLVP